jgi:hypothetical protein
VGLALRRKRRPARGTASPQEPMPTDRGYPRGNIDRYVRNRYRTEAPSIGSALPGFSHRSRARALGEHRSRRAKADATGRHLRGTDDSGQAAHPRGLLADAGNGAGYGQSSGRPRTPHWTVTVAVGSETDAPGGQSARGTVLFTGNGVVSSDGVRTPAAASPTCHVLALILAPVRAESHGSSHRLLQPKRRHRQND